MMYAQRPEHGQTDYRPDGWVTLWNALTQRWEKGVPTAAILATLSEPERAQVTVHCGLTGEGWHRWDCPIADPADLDARRASPEMADYAGQTLHLSPDGQWLLDWGEPGPVTPPSVLTEETAHRWLAACGLEVAGV